MTDDINDVRHTSTYAAAEEAIRKDERSRISPVSARDLAEELREYTAMKYAGDCKCGKCQLVPRALVERIYHTLNGSSDLAQPSPVSPVSGTVDRVALAINAAWNKIGDVPFPLYQREAEALAAAAIEAFRHTQTPREPVAYLHALHMELGQVRLQLTWTEPSPFGLPGKHYDITYTTSCTPLYAALTDTSTDREGK